MKQAIEMVQDILPTDVLSRLAGQPASVTDYAEPGFSFSLIKRLSDRLDTARRRFAFAEDAIVKKNLSEIIELLEIVGSGDHCQVWHGYFIEGAKRVEFVLVPSLLRRVVGKFNV